MASSMKGSAVLLVRLGGRLVRVSLLALAVAAAFAWWLWLPRNAALLARIDDYASTIYLNRHNGEIERIRALAADPARLAEAERAAWALAGKMGGVRKESNDIQPYFAVMQILEGITLKRNDYEGYRRVADRLTELDGNHYAFWLASADARARTGDAEGRMKALRRAFDLAPARIEAAEPLAMELYGSGDRPGAKEVLLSHLSANVLKQVVLYHSSGGAFVKSEGLGAALAALNGTQHLGFDLGGASPAVLALAMPDEPGLSFRLESVSLEQEGGPRELRQFGLSWAGLEPAPAGAFVITGAGPRLLIELPAEARAVTGKVVVKVEFQRTLPQRLAHIMGGA